MQQKNILLFLALTFLVLLGWQALTIRLWPPKPRPIAQRGEGPLAPDLNVLWSWKELPVAVQIARLAVACPAAPAGQENVFALAVALAQADPHELRPPAVVAKIPPQPPEPAPVQEPIESIRLGDDSSFLKVDVTNLGAGVRQVVLNTF